MRTLDKATGVSTGTAVSLARVAILFYLGTRGVEQGTVA